MTIAERRLWAKLRARRFENFYFRRQQPIDRYIVDFVCFDCRLVIELDGGQHAIEPKRDAVRDAHLARNGFRVLRFWNTEVMQQMEGVLMRIREALLDTPPPTPSRKGRG
jgi:very-short-patch-repair endonuclease